MAEEKKKLKKAIDEMEYLTGDEEQRRWAQLRLKAEMDENTAFSNGLEQGTISEKIETARRLLKAGVDIETIIVATKLDREEVEKLAEKL